jgi:ribonuclease inhibitor
MKEVVIDFSGAKCWNELHPIVKKTFMSSPVRGFPDFYGENPDALWDCLTGFIETPAAITVLGAAQAAKVGEQETRLILEVFREAKDQYPDRFRVTITE